MLDKYSESLRGVPSDKKIGEQYGLEWAERFKYFGPAKGGLNDYIRSNTREIITSLFQFIGDDPGCLSEGC